VGYQRQQGDRRDIDDVPDDCEEPILARTVRQGSREQPQSVPDHLAEPGEEPDGGGRGPRQG